MCAGALASVQGSCCCSELAHSLIHSAHACTEQKYVWCWFPALPCCGLFALRVWGQAAHVHQALSGVTMVGYDAPTQRTAAAIIVICHWAAAMLEQPAVRGLLSVITHHLRHCSADEMHESCRYLPHGGCRHNSADGGSHVLSCCSLLGACPGGVCADCIMWLESCHAATVKALTCRLLLPGMLFVARRL